MYITVVAITKLVKEMWFLLGVNIAVISPDIIGCLNGVYDAENHINQDSFIGKAV